jgi:uncharacterized protein
MNIPTTDTPSRTALGHPMTAAAIFLGFHQAQDEWLMTRDACERAPTEEAATACIGAAYDFRIAELDQIAKGATASAGPSFECGFARSAVERTICQHADLAAKDREMAELFAEARRREPRRTELSQREWRSMRDSCARMANSAQALQACVGEAYDIRIAELNVARQR